MAKREYLVKVAATLFKENGFEATTLKDIATKAGLDRATVYYYMGSKDEFFRESVKGILDRNLVTIEELVVNKEMSPVTKIRTLIDFLMTSYHENYPYMFLYLQESIHKIAKDKSSWAREMSLQTARFERAVLALVTEGINAGVFRADIPPALMSNTLFGMLNWTHKWYVPDNKFSLKSVIETFCNIFLDGVQTTPVRSAR